MRRLTILAVLGTASALAESPPPAPAPPPTPPDATLASLTSESLPNWLRLSGEFRTRAEGRTGFNFQPGNDDAYALFRTRLNVELLPTSWLQVYFQGQDSRVPGIDAGRPLAIFKDPFDVRQAYVRFGSASSPVKLTVGRQLLLYGAQRLLGPLDWTNTSRNWDAAKLEIGTADAKVDLFASTVVITDPMHRINQPRRGFNVHGAYGSFRKIVPASTFEPYLLWKTGGRSIYSGGFRLAAMPGTPGLHGFDYQTEIIRQWGTIGSNAKHRAWAGYGIVGRTFDTAPWKLRASAEYSYASGDSNGADSRSRTFDHILGTNHLFYGLVDAVGWQNMHNIRIGADAKPTRKLQFAADYHWLWTASASDSLYEVAGRATVRPRPGNTARAIGTELDFTLNYTLSRQWKAGGGIGHLFPGAFLKQNSAGSGMTFPFVFAQYAF